MELRLNVWNYKLQVIPVSARTQARICAQCSLARGNYIKKNA